MNTNQIIHEQLMGEPCYHEAQGGNKAQYRRCSRCGQSFLSRRQPKYDSDLNLCFAAQAKAIERFGEHRFMFTLHEIVNNGLKKFRAKSSEIIALTMASAESRCAAIVKLLENEK